MSVSIALAAFLSSSPVITAPHIAFHSALYVSTAVTQSEADQDLDNLQVDQPQATIDEQEVETPPTTDSTIVVRGDSADRGRDPLSQMNETTFEITQEVDAALVEPVANVYQESLPKPVRNGLRNFFRNLLEPVNALNYLLQLKPGKAFETVGRFAINSTVGVGGLVDVAKREPFNLPYRRNGFGNTLGYYGVEPGPFLVVPLLGPTTLRDLVGTGLDQAVLPTAVGGPFGTPVYAIPAFTVNSLESRLELDAQIAQINASEDPYYLQRELYLCQREATIAELKNRPAPRDCSIEAIVAANPFNVQQALPSEAEAGVAQMEEVSESTERAVEAPREQPAIMYVSKEVVQPTP